MLPEYLGSSEPGTAPKTKVDLQKKKKRREGRMETEEEEEEEEAKEADSLE